MEQLREAMHAEMEEALAQLREERVAKREEAVKVSARNLHDMQTEALRRSLFEKDRAHQEMVERLIREKDAHHVEVLQAMASQRDEDHQDRLYGELEAVEAEHKAIMDQLVKEKLDADRDHRDEAFNLKEKIAQLEMHLHTRMTAAQMDVRKSGDRLGRFCDWVADQRMHVIVETTLGRFKEGTIKALDSETGTATVRYFDGSEESEILLNRIGFAPAPALVTPLTSAAPVAIPKAESKDLTAVLGAMSSSERTLMVFLPLAIFPVVVVALAGVLRFAYA
jgi:nitrate reductase NapE component